MVLDEMHDLIDKLSEFLRSKGIVPLYFITVIAIPLYFILYMDDFKRWDKLNNPNKFFHITGIIVAICLIIGSILTFFGILPK